MEILSKCLKKRAQLPIQVITDRNSEKGEIKMIKKTELSARNCVQNKNSGRKLVR